MKRLCCLLLLLLPSVAAATIYKCVDNGQITYSASPCGDNAQVLPTRSAEPAQQQGTLVLYLRADRSYRVTGTVNSAPVEFVVDTGASSTVISQRVARTAGLRTCTGQGYTATANGVVSKCVATIPSISFGSFRINDLMVTILPDLTVDALLGMDVLRRMKIEQRNDAMYISD